MADRYENDLLTREYENIDVDTDYIRTLDENGVSYRDDMAKIAEVIIRRFDNASLGGTTRTVQAAFNDTFSTIDARTCTVTELVLLEQKLGIE